MEPRSGKDVFRASYGCPTAQAKDLLLQVYFWKRGEGRNLMASLKLSCTNITSEFLPLCWLIFVHKNKAFQVFASNSEDKLNSNPNNLTCLHQSISCLASANRTRQTKIGPKSKITKNFLHYGYHNFLYSHWLKENQKNSTDM